MKYEQNIHFFNLVYSLLLTICSADKYFIIKPSNSACNDRFYTNQLTFDKHTEIVLNEKYYDDFKEIPPPKKFICSGGFVTPNGQLVVKKFTSGEIYFWMLYGSVRIDCSKLKKYNNLRLNISSWIIDTSFSQVPINQENYNFPLPELPNKTRNLTCNDDEYQFEKNTRKISISWSLEGEEKGLTALDDEEQFPVKFDISSRLYYRGNFEHAEKIRYCETFNGFWCSAQQHEKLPLNDSKNALDYSKVFLSNNDDCIRLSMRCDKYPHCMTSASRPIANDEVSCDKISVIHQPNPVVLPEEPAPWHTKLPWMILGLVPIVLICALVRICSQKNNLEVIDYEENCLDNAQNEKADIGALNHIEMHDLANGQMLKKNMMQMVSKTLTPVEECREDEEQANMNSSDLSSETNFGNGPQIALHGDQMHSATDDLLIRTNYEQILESISNPDVSDVTLRSKETFDEENKSERQSARKTINSAIKKLKKIVQSSGLTSSNSSPSDSTSLVDIDYPQAIYSYQHSYQYNNDQSECTNKIPDSNYQVDDS